MDDQNQESNNSEKKITQDKNHTKENNFSSTNFEKFIPKTLVPPRPLITDSMLKAITTASVKNKLFEEITSKNNIMNSITSNQIKDLSNIVKWKSNIHPQLFNTIDIYKKIIPNQFNVVKETFKVIDWKAIKEHHEQFTNNIFQLLQETQKELWCLDIDLASQIVENEVKRSEIENHIRDNLDLYIKDLKDEPLFALHSSLIQEAYEAYQLGHYKLCTISLFAPFEHIFVCWFEGYIDGEDVNVRQRPKRPERGNSIIGRSRKLMNTEYNETERKQLMIILTMPIVHFYSKTFGKFSEHTPDRKLNRNALMHGFYNYDSITEVDVLKLFQLLKSLTVLEYLSYEDVFGNDSSSVSKY